jgi:hypothetical protein
MKTRLTAFIRRKKKTAWGIGILLITLVTASWYCSEIDELWPTEETFKAQAGKHRKLLLELELNIGTRKVFESEKKHLQEESRYFYFPANNKRPDELMRQKIEELAKHAGLVIKSLSDIKKQNISRDVCSWEINLMAEGALKQTVAFLAGLKKTPPAFYWPQCNIRPANTNPDGGTALVLTGTLKMIGCENGDADELSWIIGK